jgi:hypothetical protein
MKLQMNFGWVERSTAILSDEFYFIRKYGCKRICRDWWRSSWKRGEKLLHSQGGDDAVREPVDYEFSLKQFSLRLVRFSLAASAQ